MSLSFYKPFKNAYVVYDANKRVGFITMEDDITIKDIDIFAKAQVNDLIKKFMENVGKDEIYALTENENIQIYKQYGFKQCDKNVNDKMLLKCVY